MEKLSATGLREFRRCAMGLAAVAVLLLSSAHAYADNQSYWARDTLTGDWGGARTRLSNKGIDWSLMYTGQVFINTSGGLVRGSAYQDLFDFQVDADLDKLFGWKGATAHVSLYQIDDGGRNAGDLIGSIGDPSTIDALPTSRLFTLYLEQSLGSYGSLRIGQIAAGDELVISNTAAFLLNGTFGWPNFVDDSLPGGGPAYPLATPGVRLELDPSEEVKVLTAVFSGNPAGDCPPNLDPEICNKHGTTFSFEGGALFIGEVQYKPKDKLNSANSAGPPESVYRLGGWYHTEFPDLLDPNDPPSGNGGVYGIVDQTVWHNDATALTLFMRIAAMPEDRSPISFYLDGGFGITGPFTSRPNDVIALGLSYTNISSDLAAFQEAQRRATGINTPIADYEGLIELTYIAQITPWWSLQPDLQYIINPGGNVPSPNNPTRAVEDSFFLGLSTSITF